MLSGPAPAGPARTLRALPWLLGLLGLLIYHRYSLLTGLDLVQADAGDSRFLAFLLEHWNAVLHGRGHWRSPPIFFPVRGTLGYSDAVFVMGVLQAALRTAGLGVFAAMNAGLVVWSALSYAGAFLFLRRGFAASVGAASVGAFFFAYSWPRFAQLVHVQLQFTAFLPIMALLLLECLRDGLTLGRPQVLARLAGLAVLFDLLLATTVYYAVFFAIACVAAVGLCLLDGRGRRQLLAVLRRHWAASLGAAVLAGVLLLPVVAVYRPVLRQSGGRDWAEVARFLLQPGALLWMGRENGIWGGLAGRWTEQEVLARWPEGRLGVGLVASVGWLVALGWAVRTAWRGGGCRATAAVVLTGALLQLAVLRFGATGSAWWLLFRFFPGAAGLRAIGRIEIVVTLSMALGFAAVLDAAWRAAGRARAGRAWRAALVMLCAAGLLEQVGQSRTYSGRAAEALSRQVVEAVPAGCKAFYVLGAPGMLPPAPAIRSEAGFDPEAYLRANPDLVGVWTGTPWQHYEQFGRAEGRYLDPALNQRHQGLLFFYNYTIPLGAVLASVPAVNGLSGWQPKGWNLFDVFSPEAPARVARWLSSQGQDPAAACLTTVALDPEALPESSGRWLP